MCRTTRAISEDGAENIRTENEQMVLTSVSCATQWFEARLRFSRSCAAWSMLGHIVGLGDRHAKTYC